MKSVLEIRVDPELRSLIPPLTVEERTQLEENIKRDGCRDPLVLWDDVLIDGHNRFEICTNLSLPFQTKEIVLESRDEAKSWIIRNQFGRRNLQPFQRAELALKLEPLIAAKAAENIRAAQNNDSASAFQKSDKQVHTAKEVAKIAGLSHDTIHKAKVIVDKATEEVKEKLRAGETSIDREYQQIKKAERKEQVVEEIKAAAPLGKYHVLVVDPPWPMEKIEREVRPNQHGFDYPTMSLEEIQAFQFPDGRSVEDASVDHSHLFLWTTHKFLPDAFRIVEAWGYRYVCTFVWHKPGGFQPIGLPQYNCEFAIYGRRGTPSFIDTTQFNCCFDAPRQEHSRKPKEFYDLLRRVTMEPRIDIFNREKHEGFEQFGNEIGKFN